MKLYSLVIEENGIPIMGSYAPSETQQQFLTEIKELYKIETKPTLEEEHKELLKKLNSAKIIEINVKEYDITTHKLTDLIGENND